MDGRTAEEWRERGLERLDMEDCSDADDGDDMLKDPEMSREEVVGEEDRFTEARGVMEGDTVGDELFLLSKEDALVGRLCCRNRSLNSLSCLRCCSSADGRRPGDADADGGAALSAVDMAFSAAEQREAERSPLKCFTHTCMKLSKLQAKI